MNILIANDHGAVELKSAIVEALVAKGHRVENLGVDSGDSVDYPDMAKLAAERYLAGGFDFGILCCGSGSRGGPDRPATRRSHRMRPWRRERRRDRVPARAIAERSPVGTR